MEHPVLWSIALVRPGEREVALLADLVQRRDVRVLGVLDPGAEAEGTAIAELLAIPVYADLEAGELRRADYLVYPTGDMQAEALVRDAESRGFTPISSRDFARLLSPVTLETKALPRAPESFEHLERETESIHRTLSRIEEALERESLLRWLLSLATRAVGATSGSIMLRDESSDELYIAFAYGLSEATMHRTRVQAGEGIAGRVARSQQSEIVKGRQEDELQRDRPEITSAICAPLLWESELLGVLNVSTASGDRELDDEDLATVDRLARRLSLILHRFLGLQRAQAGILFREMDSQLRSLVQESADIETILAAWSGNLALRLQAVRCGLAVLCADGSLLVAEGTEDGRTSSRHESLENDAWRDVLQTGSPLVVRQSEAGPDQPAGLTVFYLPVGKDPVRAVLTLVFTSAARAHRFHDVSGEILYLLEKRLVELISRVQQRDRLERLTALTTALADLAAFPPGDPRAADRFLLESARRLCGARRAFLATGLVQGEARLEGDDVPDDPAWLAEAGRLLAIAQQRGWTVTLLSDRNEPRLEESCLLTVTAGSDASVPGLLLYGKQKLHPLDGAVFTEFDAELAQRLAHLVSSGPGGRDTPTSPQMSPAAQEPPDGSQPPVPAVLIEAPPSAGTAGEPRDTASARAPREVLLETLRREMDRCDRYHTTFALVAFRPASPASWDEGQAQKLVDLLRSRVRSSDVVTWLPDGTLLLIAPEDVQAVSRLERRLVGEIRKLAGSGVPALAAGHSVYPGRHDDPQLLLEATIGALHPRP
jgi:GAF domain-containing protein